MLYYFPDTSDLKDVSGDLRMFWENEFSIRENYARYFDGVIFKERVDQEVNIEDEVLLYPVGLNLVKMLCIAQADGLFGEWEESIFNFEVRREDTATEPAKAAIKLLSSIMENSNANAMFWEAALDREVYGGVPLKVTPDLKKTGHIKWSRVPIQSFFPVYDPDDPDELLEVYVIIPMTKDQARAKYGYTGSTEIPIRVEHWTKEFYTNELDGIRIDAYSGINPWGFVPFVYIPRLRTRSYFGDSLTEEIIPVQDELNMRMGDLSEAINYNTHPIKWGYNLPAKFNADNYSIGSNSFWDLGRVLGGSEPPKVGLLQADKAIPDGAFEYLNFIYDWGRVSAFSPPVVFGMEDGGGQRSGATIELRMWSYVKSLRRSRAYMTNGIKKLAWMSAMILKQKKLEDVPSRALDCILSGGVVPVLPEIMPRDHQAIVDEVVKLLSLEYPGISIYTAQKKLGNGAGEVDRIKEMLKDKELRKEQFKMDKAQQGEKGKMQPQAKNEDPE
ncbi:MAG: phage portal protein [Deltaproteobacteria bacterium]|nr:phage portal protein [Deltaproteobacteria bacterium]